MTELDYHVERTETAGEAGYHFRVVDARGTERYRSADHLEELRIPPAGYPNAHLARAVAHVVCKQLAGDKSARLSA